jgi:hypothetical protein
MFGVCRIAPSLLKVAKLFTPAWLQVLAQAADYRPPTAASTGQYSLKRECWREFDPFYLHYTT